MRVMRARFRMAAFMVLMVGCIFAMLCRASEASLVLFCAAALFAVEAS